MDCLLAGLSGKKGEDSKKENKNLDQFVFADFSSKKVTEFGLDWKFTSVSSSLWKM